MRKLLRLATGRDGSAAAADNTQSGSRAPCPDPTGSDGLYARALSAVESFFDAAGTGPRSSGDLAAAGTDLVAIGDHLADEVRDDQEMVGLAMAPYPAATTFLVPHSVNVAILAVRAASGAGLSDESARLVCRAGLAHDIGCALPDDGAVEDADRLDPVPRAAPSRRPSASRRVVEETGPPLADVASMVGQVYERLDGSGHPRGLSGNEILMESRLLGAAEHLDRMVHAHQHGQDSAGATASLGVQQLMKMATAFGEEVLKGMVRGIGLFPVGTLVRLSTGEVAQVRQNRTHNPMRPLVTVLETAGASGPRRARTVDLVDTPHVYVSRPLSATDLDRLGGGGSRKSLPRNKPTSEHP